MSGLKEKLMNGEKRIGVWGVGFIGFSSMANFAVNGVRCIGTDVVQKTVDDINNGKIAIDNLEYWLGFDIKPLVEAGLMTATTDWKKLLDKDVAVHLVCIPTEKDGRPYDDILVDVIKKISGFHTDGSAKDSRSCSRKKARNDGPPLVIIESTLTPKRTDEVVIPMFEKAGLKVGKDILLGVAPRRDWFISPDKSLKTLPRIVGGTTPETTAAMLDVLSVVCDTLLPAKDHRHAELVKSIENAYRHVEITLANQLSLAYPDVNMREVLRLVGTKWNIGTYHPSFGTGGYCIPLSSQYVLLGTKHPERLGILNATISSDRNMPYTVADSLIKRGVKKVGILGLAYKGDIKVHILSPTIKIAERLKEKKIQVKIHDPYYTKDEIKRIAGTDTFKFPEGLGEFDALLVVTDHRAYASTPHKTITDKLKSCKLVVDNTGVWRDIPFSKIGVEYHVAGDSKWL